MPDGRSAPSRHRQERRDKRRRTNRKREKLFHNLGWLLGSLAVGLPVLAAVLYLLSR